jgi:hypothetical protein
VGGAGPLLVTAIKAFKTTAKAFPKSQMKPSRPSESRENSTAAMKAASNNRNRKDERRNVTVSISAGIKAVFFLVLCSCLSVLFDSSSATKGYRHNSQSDVNESRSILPDVAKERGNVNYTTDRKKHINTVEQELLENAIKLNPKCKGKEFYLRILLSAADSPNRKRVTQRCAQLPTLEDVYERYGRDPVVIGMDTCQRYRDSMMMNNTTYQTELMPRIAGLYHTGTNALANSFVRNLKPIKNRVRRRENPYDVPWGKHMPPNVFRHNNSITKKEFPVDKDHVLPIVIVRDPFYWMKSMCKESYDAKWEKPKDRRCPALINEETNQVFPVLTRLEQANWAYLNYTSLIGMWVDWYAQYLNADYPRLLIRFEDVLYRQEEIVQLIRDCVGMPSSTQPFARLAGKAKSHGDSSDYATALIKYISDDTRHQGLNQLDRDYANKVLPKDMMDLFGYKYAPLVETEDLTINGSWPGQHLPNTAKKNQWWISGVLPRPGKLSESVE